jgi:hypothetical protein
MIKRSTIVIVILLSIFCAKIPPHVGKSRDVVVLATKIDTSLIIDNLQVYNYVPQKEEIFTFLYAADTAIKNYNKFHTIYLYGSLQDDFINTLLSAEAREATKKDTFTLFRLNDLWAKGQLAIILATSENQYIEPGVKKYSKLISQILTDNYYQRIKENYYSESVDKRVKDNLEKFGVSLDFHKGWIIDSTYKKENFLFLHTHFPDRNIFVYKEKNKEELTDSLVINKRDDLTKKYYNGDYILKELTKAEKIEFKNMKGVRLKGIWQNDSLVAGGPFISYFLQDNDTLFIVDGLLFYPGERKSDYLAQIEVIMNSFTIIHP